MANELSTRTQQKTGIATYLGGEATRANIAGVIGKENVTRFVSSVVSAVQANPQLATCTNASIVSAALQGEALKLAPSPQLGHFYMTPFKTRKKVNGEWVESTEAAFTIGAKGYIQLAIRSGQYRTIVVNDVRQGEIEFNPITEEMTLTPIMDPEQREKTPIIGYYAMFELLNGFKKELYASKASIEAHARRYSASYRYDIESGKKSSIWSTNFDAMAKKTLIRQLIGKWGIMSVEMQRAYENDMAVIDDEEGGKRYVDNPTTVEAVVADDISAHANTETFVEADVVDSAPAPKAAPKQSKAAPKKSQPVPDDLPDFMS
jgi:recombination protein RecT